MSRVLLIPFIDSGSNVTVPCSLKDDDSGDHDQDNVSSKDCEKEKNEEEEKDPSAAKKKVCVLVVLLFIWGLCDACGGDVGCQV